MTIGCSDQRAAELLPELFVPRLVARRCSLGGRHWRVADHDRHDGWHTPTHSRRPTAPSTTRPEYRIEF
jgi:hypothetical protein